MSSETHNQPAFLRVAPRFVVGDMEQALAFYEQRKLSDWPKSVASHLRK